MASEEKGQWVYIVAIVVTYAAYLVITLGQLGQTAPSDIDYVPAMHSVFGFWIVLAGSGASCVILYRAGRRNRWL